MCAAAAVPGYTSVTSGNISFLHCNHLNLRQYRVIRRGLEDDVLSDRRAPLPESHPWHRSKWTGAAVVAAVHVVLIGFVMLSTPRTIELIPGPREIYYVFHPKPPRKLPFATITPSAP